MRIFAIVLAAGAAQSLAQTATFTPLGSLSGSIDSSYATGVSDNGRVVAGGANSFIGNEGFRWENGVMIGLGVLPGGSTNSEAFDISGDGQVVIGQGWNGSHFEAYRSTPGGLVGIGTLNPGSSANIHSVGFATNQDGSVIVGFSRNAADTGIVAFRWTPAGMSALPLLGGTTLSVARGVSGDGTTVVGESGSLGFVWTEGGGSVALPTPVGGTGNHRAFNISDDKSTVVGTANTDRGVEAARWVNGVGEILGSLPNDDEEWDAIAYACSADGSIVVGGVLANQPGGFGPRYQAFIWNEEDGLRLLQDVLEDVYGLTLPPESVLLEANDISPDGKTIVGSWLNADVVVEGFVVHLDVCGADLSGSSDPNDASFGVPDGAVDASDFFYFLDQFAANNFAVADLSGSSDPNDPAYGMPDGLIDAADFFYYLDLFVAGCA